MANRKKNLKDTISTSIFDLVFFLNDVCYSLGFKNPVCTERYCPVICIINLFGAFLFASEELNYLFTISAMLLIHERKV